MKQHFFYGECVWYNHIGTNLHIEYYRYFYESLSLHYSQCISVTLFSQTFPSPTPTSFTSLSRLNADTVIAFYFSLLYIYLHILQTSLYMPCSNNLCNFSIIILSRIPKNLFQLHIYIR